MKFIYNLEHGISLNSKEYSEFEVEMHERMGCL